MSRKLCHIVKELYLKRVAPQVNYSAFRQILKNVRQSETHRKHWQIRRHLKHWQIRRHLSTYLQALEQRWQAVQ